jgi:DNA-binding response OmpR family regulator
MTCFNSYTNEKGNMRILIAGGDLPFIEMLQSYFWDREHEAEIAADGLECSAVLRYFVPDVVVLEHDLLWGGGDGVMALMRSDEELADVPVILIGDESRHHWKYVAAGPPVIGWLQRPFSLGDLMRQIDRGLQRNRLPGIEART